MCGTTILGRRRERGRTISDRVGIAAIKCWERSGCLASSGHGARAAGGPLKPSFGLSGAVPLLDRVSLPPVPAFALPTRIQPPLARCVLAITAPLPVLRAHAQSALHRVPMNISKLF